MPRFNGAERLRLAHFLGVEFTGANALHKEVSRMTKASNSIRLNYSVQAAHVNLTNLYKRRAVAEVQFPSYTKISERIAEKV
jgi:hypothetical protein